MRISTGLLLLAVAGSTVAIDSKTWMHKGVKIHVSIGQKESASIGTFLVTLVAPGGKRATVRADRDGTILNAWAADVDADGKFEVIVATQSAGTGSYGRVGIFTWTGKGLKDREVPELNSGQIKGYMGHDEFSVSRNQLYRTFPTFVQQANDPAQRTGMRTLRLNLAKFRWEKV